MSEHLDVASIEARILSLDATSITVLGWLPYSRNDKEIIRRSGAWNYTPAIIERSLERIFKAFAIDGIACASSKRQRAIDMYLAFKNAEYPLTAFSRRGRNGVATKSAKEFFYDEEESNEMGIVDNLDSNRVGTLKDVQLKILKALSEGKDKYVISRDLKITVEAVVDEAPRIFAHLQIESSSLEEKRRIACELYADYVEEHGEPDIEVTSAVSAEAKNRVVGNGADHDLNRLARTIAGLSPRVKEVAGHLAAGLDIPAIAKAMDIAESSVQPYASNVYSKLGLHHSLGAAKRQGILKLAHELFASGTYEAAGESGPVEAKLPPATPGTASTEVSGVNIAVVAQKLAKLTPRLLELALCLIRDKDPLKELEVAPSTLAAYKGSLFSQLGLTGRGLTRKERLKILGFAYEKAFPNSSPAPIRKGEEAVSRVIPAQVVPESVRIPEPPLPIESKAPEAMSTDEPEKATAVDTMLQYGQGVPIILSEPETILDVAVISGRHAVISGRHQEGVFDKEVQNKRQSGFHPEVLVVYPTANPSVSFAQLVLIKRKH